MSLILLPFSEVAMVPLASVCKRPEISHIPDTLTTRRGHGYDIDFDNAEKSVLVDFRDKDFLAAVFCGDAARFVRATTHTIDGLHKELESGRTFPWALVKLYYAAYYSGHAILRAQGTSLSFLDGTNLRNIKELTFAAATQPDFQVKRGQHTFQLSNGSSGVSISNKGKSDGGVHEEFWHVLKENLATLGKTALSSDTVTQSEGQQIFSKLTDLEQVISGNGCNGGNWLSFVRNAVQYRHHYNSWPPSNLRARERRTLAQISALWKSDPMDIALDERASDLVRFTSAAVFLVAMLGRICGWMAEVSPEGRKCYLYSATRPA